MRYCGPSLLRVAILVVVLMAVPVNAQVDDEVVNEDRDRIGLAGTGHHRANGPDGQNDPAVVKRRGVDYAAGVGDV